MMHCQPIWRLIERWKKVDLARAADEDLLEGVRTLAVADAVYWFAAAVPLGLARMTDALLDSFLQSDVAGRIDSTERAPDQRFLFTRLPLQNARCPG
jgi:hypothetical protein